MFSVFPLSLCFVYESRLCMRFAVLSETRETGRRVLVSSFCFPLSPFHPFDLTVPSRSETLSYCRLTQTVCFVFAIVQSFLCRISPISQFRVSWTLLRFLPCFFSSLLLCTALQRDSSNHLQVHSKCLKSRTLFFPKIPSFSLL